MEYVKLGNSDLRVSRIWRPDHRPAFMDHRRGADTGNHPP